MHAGFLDRQPRVVAHWIPAFAGMTKSAAASSVTGLFSEIDIAADARDDPL